EMHAGTARLGEADRDRLLRGAGAVLPFADVVHLLAHELAGLGGQRLPLPLVPGRALQRLLLGHVRSFPGIGQQERCPTALPVDALLEPVLAAARGRLRHEPRAGELWEELERALRDPLRVELERVPLEELRPVLDELV